MSDPIGKLSIGGVPEYHGMNNGSIASATDTEPEILFITSFPPRECGIATYSQDLITAIEKQFHHSFKISICALESDFEHHEYSSQVQYILNVDHADEFRVVAEKINANPSIRMVVVQHEFGFYAHKKAELQWLLAELAMPVIVAFHTVLPHPNDALKQNVRVLSILSQCVIVMTNTSAEILSRDYEIAAEHIVIIAHGTHLVPHTEVSLLKAKYNLYGKKILSTFGLLSSGKGIETTLEALPQIVKQNPDVLFLIIGKTHPSVFKQEGERYREQLKSTVERLQLQHHVRFINQFVPLPQLLEYLQLTDIYLFTSKDPNQAVSGTFSYAISCGCPIISTPIPHALEVLKDGAGVIVDFNNSEQLSAQVIRLLADDSLRERMSSEGLHRMASTAWENSAIAHAMLFQKIGGRDISLVYNLPPIKIDHLKRMTTDVGIIQFSNISQPDITSGYTLDDNARALIAICQHFEATNDSSDLLPIRIYVNFIEHCLQSYGRFLNYVDEAKRFTEQNISTNLEDSNGRAIWALGFVISMGNILPPEVLAQTTSVIEKAMVEFRDIRSTRAMAFAIKGIYYYSLAQPKNTESIELLTELADRLVQMYRHEADEGWRWFESYLTYANSLIPEALLCAWLISNKPIYKEIAEESFSFLLSKTFHEQKIRVISNRTWLHRNHESVPPPIGGEQPIDVAYTVLALKRFYEVFGTQEYAHKMTMAFNWFLGNNHLRQIVYNPCTGGCYDGLEENYVNLNQGAESTVSYLMARLSMNAVLPAKLQYIPIEHKNLLLH